MVEPREKSRSSSSSSSSEVSVKLELETGGGSTSEAKEVYSRGTSASGSAVNNGNDESSGQLILFSANCKYSYYYGLQVET